MTSPEDGGLEEALRRALYDAASEFGPGPEGLDKIRARIGHRPSRPWLSSVLVGLVDRIRHWTWRGHWAWQDSLPGLGALRERRSRRGNFPGWGIGSLRFVTVLAAIAVVASIALGVQPFRHAILQASDSLKGGGGPPRGSAGTEGNGTQASSGSPATAAVASASGQASQVRTTASGKTAVPHRTSSGRCVSTALPVLSGAKAGKTSVAPETSGTTPGTAEASSPPSSGSATPARPVYTNTNAATCPVAPPTRTPSPTPTSSSSSPIPTPASVAPTQESSPTGTDPAQSPAPTASGSSPTADPPSSRPSDPPSWSWQGRQERRYADFPDGHHWRR